ncbi:UNVERIFIED_CONTAM: hypothetical protein Sindi_1310100 [Sesamum indicum]
MSKNPLTAIPETNKFNGTNYNDCLQNLRIVLDFENQICVLARSLPRALLEGSTCEQYLTFKKWHEDKWKEHGVKMLSLMEKLKGLKTHLEKETYIDVILQYLPHSFDLFIVNCNMNRLDKGLHELINILVQYEAMIEKSAPLLLVREASTSEAKGKRLDAGGGRRVRQNQLLQALRALLFLS